MYVYLLETYITLRGIVDALNIQGLKTQQGIKTERLLVLEIY